MPDISYRELYVQRALQASTKLPLILSAEIVMRILIRQRSVRPLVVIACNVLGLSAWDRLLEARHVLVRVDIQEIIQPARVQSVQWVSIRLSLGAQRAWTVCPVRMDGHLVFTCVQTVGFRKLRPLGPRTTLNAFVMQDIIVQQSTPTSFMTSVKNVMPERSS